MSKLKDISIQALRLYDREGLLKPAYVNQDNGYRYYHVSQFLIIDIIKYCKQVGIPYSQLKGAFLENNIQYTISILIEQKVKALQEIEALKIAVDDIEAIENQLNLLKAENSSGEPYIKYFPSRYFLSASCSIEPTPEEIEMAFINLGIVQKHDNLKGTFESGLIHSIENQTIKESQVYTCVKNFGNKKSKLIKFFPKGNYLCLNYKTPDKQYALKKLYDFLLAKNINNATIIDIESIGYIFYPHHYLRSLQIFFPDVSTKSEE